MKKNISSITRLLFLFLTVSATVTVAQNSGFDKPIPDSARRNIQRATKLQEQEKFAEAAIEYQKSIAAAPNFVQAHAGYINLKSYFLEQLDQVKTEYETLAAKNPSNSVYPAALAIGLFAEPTVAKNKWLEAVVRLTPDSAWGHYAQGKLLEEKEPQKALAEYSKAVEKDASLSQAYSQMIFIQEVKLKNIDDAMTIAEIMALQPDLKTAATSVLWRLRLKKAGTTDEAKNSLREELGHITESSIDPAALIAVYGAYQNLLKDKDAATLVKEKIKRIDPFWYPERGSIATGMTLDDKGVHSFVYAGRQLTVYNKLREIEYDLESKEQTTRLEQLLSLNPNAELKKSIYDRLIGLSLNDKNDTAAVSYGEKLLEINPKDASILATVARIMANQKQDLETALGYARRAEELTRELVILKDVPGIAGNKFFEDYYTEKHQTERYNARRADALDTYGWLLFKTGKTAEAEAKVREAMKFRRSENNLTHLAEILKSLNHLEESENFALEAKNIYLTNIKSKFKNEPAKDFELTTVDGRKVKLSDLKGKIVMVNFWATWCKPCVKEMPMFVKIYEKYKERGFEILAITVDAPEDRPKVVSFAEQQKINFPILFDESAAALYGVRSYPTTFFIGKQGTIRLQDSGLNLQTAERDLEIIIEELMKDK